MVLQRDQRDFFYALLCCPGLCKSRYHGQKEIVLPCRERLHVTYRNFYSQGQKIPKIRGGPNCRSKNSSFITLLTVVWQLNLLLKEVEVMAYCALRDLGRSELLKPFILIRETEAHLKSGDVLFFLIIESITDVPLLPQPTDPLHPAPVCSLPMPFPHSCLYMKFLG